LRQGSANASITKMKDTIKGYLKYGHLEGDIEIPEKDVKEFENHPINYILNYCLTDYLDLRVDDFEVEECGDIDEVNFTRKE